VKVTLHAQAFIDRRSLDLHCRYDHILQQRWRLAVERNIKERWRLERQRIAALERGVANMGPGWQGQAEASGTANTSNRSY